MKGIVSESARNNVSLLSKGRVPQEGVLQYLWVLSKLQAWDIRVAYLDISIVYFRNRQVMCMLETELPFFLHLAASAAKWAKIYTCACGQCIFKNKHRFA